MEATQQSIKLKTQKNTVAPKINAIDPLSSAKPIVLNKKVENGEENKKTESALNTQDSAPKTESVSKPQVAPTINKEELLRMQQAKLQAQEIKKRQEMAQKATQNPAPQATLRPNESAPKAQTAQIQPNPQTAPKSPSSPKVPNPQPQASAPQPQAMQSASSAPNPQPQASAQSAQNSAPKPSAPSVPQNMNFATDAVAEDDYYEQQGAEDGRIDAPSEALQKNPNLQSLAVNVEQLDFAVTKRVRAYLKKLISVGGSDLHLKAGGKIRARINGDIVIFSEEIFTKESAITFAKELTRTRFPEFALNKEMDMTYIYDKTTRFRVNIFFQMDGVSFAFRRIPTTQNTIAELGLPEAIQSIVDMERGLVLVTGITGSGKSTTLAAIINEINRKHAKHIITIEDPIEFIHKDIHSIVNQRSVGMDTNSFAGALKSALREDPDIILVGEMRDIETIEMALHAAETGHLVLSTLHTLDAKETINRVVSVFPTHDQRRIRATLASTLNAIISQRLLKARNGGRIAAVELLFRTPRIELIINEARDGEIAEALAEGTGIYHTQTFDQHLFNLVVDGTVDENVAMEKATSPSDLKLKLQNINFQEQGSNVSDTIGIKR